MNFGGDSVVNQQIGNWGQVPTDKGLQVKIKLHTTARLQSKIPVSFLISSCFCCTSDHNVTITLYYGVAHAASALFYTIFKLTTAENLCQQQKQCSSQSWPC